MALGGGNFTTQNKELPGTYINFVSASSANPSLSERGITTMPLELDWGPEGCIFEVDSGEFRKDSMKIFGYPDGHDKLKGIRDLFLGARKLYAYRLNKGGIKASNAYAEAKYAGTRGNDIKIVVQEDADHEEQFHVMAYLDHIKIDSQTVRAASELKSNDYVTYKTDAVLEETAASPLEGGANGTVDGTAYQEYADLIESYSYNTMGIVATDQTTKELFAAFNKRMRDEMGIKFQLVIHDCQADYMGVINVKNRVEDQGWPESSLVYWVTGAQAGCEINKSCQNKRYDGEFAVNTKYTQTQLVDCIKAGEFVLHNVNDDIRVLDDINSMVTVTDTVGSIFKDNQTIRVIDQIGNDIAVLFNTKYLGAIPNDNAGRVSLWSDIVSHHRQMERIRAIEEFKDSDVIVEQGDTRKSVVIADAIMVAGTMSKLYLTVTVA